MKRNAAKCLRWLMEHAPALAIWGGIAMGVTLGGFIAALKGCEWPPLALTKTVFFVGVCVGSLGAFVSLFDVVREIEHRQWLEGMRERLHLSRHGHAVLPPTTTRS